MKAIIVTIVVVLLGILGGIYFYTQTPHQPQNPSPTPVPITSSPTVSSTYCSPQDLVASYNSNAGAGNIYLEIMITNISNRECEVIGNNYIAAQYDTQTIKNISLHHMGTVEKDIFTLSPNQTLYSQIHYPNGPQCQGPTQAVQVVFTYAISSTSTITFNNTQEHGGHSFPVCSSPTDITTIDIWNMSAQPITPQ